MTHKALIKRLETTCFGLDHVDPLRLLVDDVIEALRENAMREVQRLGQEIEQEPVAWVSEDVCKGQYIDGRPRKIWWECEKGVGTAFYTTPPQQEPVALESLLGAIARGWCHEKNANKEMDSDLAMAIATEVKTLYATPPQLEERNFCQRCGKRTKDIHTCTPPQRTWVGLTDEDRKQISKEANYHWEMTTGEYAEQIGQLTEAKLKEKNT